MLEKRRVLSRPPAKSSSSKARNDTTGAGDYGSESTWHGPWPVQAAHFRQSVEWFRVTH